MNKTNHLLCAHGAIVFAVLLSIGFFFLPGWFPPLKPDLTPEVFAQYFSDHRVQIRLGMTIAAFASAFWWAFSAAIAMQMRRIEGKFPILSYVQMATSSGTVLIVLFACYFILAASYRPDLPAPVARVLVDLGWLMNIGAYPPGLLQNLAIGLCILGDRRETPIYPRWVGYANLWIAMLYLPGAMLPFFHKGPFAWNGVIGFWLVAFFFFGWINMMWWYTVKAIKQQQDD